MPIKKILIMMLFLFAFGAVSKVEQADSDYTYSQKEEYLAKIRSDLNNIKMDLDDLEKSVKRASGHAKKEANDKIRTTKVRVSKLNEEVAELKASSEKEWKEVKKKYIESVSRAKDAIESSRKWLSTKIAPDTKQDSDGFQR
jgi:peptidoglycan hydrolase CwlO-like protein